MTIDEIFTDKETKIFRVTNFYETEEIADWQVEKTPFQIIPDPAIADMYDEVLIVRGFLVGKGKTENCFMEICMPERISEFIFRMINNEVVIDNAYEKNLKAIPAMASDCYGDYELYYSEENPQIGINVLKEGLDISSNKNVVAEDLGYILTDEGKLEEAVEAFKLSEQYGTSSEYTYWELACLYEQLGLKNEKEKYLQKFKDRGGKDI